MERSGAFGEAIVFLEHFEGLADPRQRGKVRYTLDAVLLLCLLAVLAGGETVTDIARFGEKKLELLRRFRPFLHGTPSHDQLGTILASLDAQQFQQCFVAWVAAMTGAPAEVIAIDGKSLRRSYQKKGATAPLLDMLAIEGAIVTLDAMGCQRAVAQKILDKKADYLLALKGNQTSLHEDLALFLAERTANGFQDTAISRHQTVDGGHGRIETRTTTVIKDIAWLQQRHNWPGLKTIVMVESTREPGAKSEHETRLSVSSLALGADKLGPIVRSHWAIENSLHWVMDMVFRDDECRLRTDHAPANFTTIKHMAHNLLRRASTKDSLRMRRKGAAWYDSFLASLISS
jgi:predicted transposase YbfD/YdcC